ncbi:hypothetical protein HYV49_04710 [Candidatus Pacearchaeota archaeon]|nr:hypothetical protein [Candidatus Pacearchaeota archaeon]
MNIKFEVIDKTRRRLRMTDWNWEHIIRRHPEISSEKEKIIETLENPDKIKGSIKDENAKFYYKYYKHRNFPNKFMMVLGKYLNGEGFIISAHFVPRII